MAARQTVCRRFCGAPCHALRILSLALFCGQRAGSVPALALTGNGAVMYAWKTVTMLHLRALAELL